MARNQKYMMIFSNWMLHICQFEPGEMTVLSKIFTLKKWSRAYCPKGFQFFHYNLNVFVVVLVRVFIDPVISGSADCLVGLDKDGFHSFDVTATVRARMASWLLLKNY